MAERIFHWIRVGAIPLLIAAIVLLEKRQSFDMFRLATFILVFLLLADVASVARGKLRDLMLVLAAIAFGTVLIEAAARSMEPKTSLNITRGWSVRQPLIGWGPEHPGRFHSEKINSRTGATIYIADYTVDSNLLRQTLSCDAGAAIVFFGCSFTFGDGVNDADTLPQVFADTLDRKQRVLNLGFTGYGPQQFLRELEIGWFDNVIGPRPRLFIYLTAPWHAERTSCKAYWMLYAPRYAIEDDHVVYKGACVEGLRRSLSEWAEHSAAYRMIVEPYRHKINHDDIELYIRTVLAAVNLAEEKYGVQTLIPYIRAQDGYLRDAGFTDDEIMMRFKEGGALVVDASLSEDAANGIEIMIPGDGHPTVYANHARASLIKNYIERNFPRIPIAEAR